MTFPYSPDRHHRHGSAMLLVMMGLILGFVLVSATVGQALSTYRNVVRQVRMERAHFLAETGLQRAADTIVNYAGSFPATLSGSGTLGGGTWSYLIRREGWKRYSVKSTGTFQGLTRRLRIGRARYPTFADFGMWTGNLQGLWTLPGQEFFGKFFSGTIINIWSSQSSGGPVWHGQVTSAANSFGGTWQYATFDQGYQLGVNQGSLANVDFPEMLGEAQTYGLVLDGATQVRFQTDSGEGKLYIKNLNRWPDGQYHAMDASSREIIYIRDAYNNPGTLTVDGGTLKGQVSFFTESDITIQGHVLMDRDPETCGDSTDKLGLITKDDIWVGTSAPNNLRLQAALLATGQKTGGGRFGVIDYANTTRGSRGVRYLFGSQATATTAAAGTFNSSTGVQTAGYRSSISYDARFLENPPPYYPPIDDKLVFEQWAYDED